MVTLRTDWNRRGRQRGVRRKVGIGIMAGGRTAAAGRVLSSRVSKRCTPVAVNAVIATAAAVLLMVYAGTAVGEKYLAARTTPVIQVRVQSGDTLWNLATRYGNPNEYILRRVQRLSVENHLAAGTSLQLGQTLKVRIENPDELAKVASGR